MQVKDYDRLAVMIQERYPNLHAVVYAGGLDVVAKSGHMEDAIIQIRQGPSDYIFRTAFPAVRSLPVSGCTVDDMSYVLFGLLDAYAEGRGWEPVRK